MKTHQTVRLISFIIVLVCILAALLIYHFTGHIVVALFIAPPVIHWILRKRSEKRDG